jgi:hypothetical protein
MKNEIYKAIMIDIHAGITDRCSSTVELVHPSELNCSKIHKGNRESRTSQESNRQQPIAAEIDCIRIAAWFFIPPILLIPVYDICYRTCLKTNKCKPIPGGGKTPPEDGLF